jgi:hypothetical protein
VNRRGRGGRRAQGASRSPLNTILGILAAQPLSAWFDPDWTPGVTIADDAGTPRMTSLQSRPISGQSQYVVSQGSLPLAPALSTSPNGRRLLAPAGAQYLSGAATLAAQFVGLAQYTAVAVASLGSTAAGAVWSLSENAATSNLVNHLTSNVTRLEQAQRIQAAAATTNLGSAVPIGVGRVLSAQYTGAAYSTWIHGVASIVASANTRAPAVLDELILCARRIVTVQTFWTGLAGPLLLVSGVLSASTRQTLERSVGLHYGYPL